MSAEAFERTVTIEAETSRDVVTCVETDDQICLGVRFARELPPFPRLCLMKYEGLVPQRHHRGLPLPKPR